MTSLPVDGLTRRALTRDDATLAAAILDADEVSLGLQSRLEAQDVLDWWARADLARDSWLFEHDGRPAAIGWLELHGDVVIGMNCVHPDAKGRGVGTYLVGIAEEHARARGVQTIRLFAVAADAAGRALLETHGYRDVRHYFEMGIDLRDEPPEPELPPGVAIESFRPEDARAWYDAANEAFSDEWGFAPAPFEEWWKMRSGAPDFDPTLWFLVRDGERIAAFARCEARRRGGGFVGMLGVRREWRRRGLGLALLRHALREFRRRGAARASLGVDSENPTGATRLYERAGMRVEAEYVLFERVL